MWVMSSKPCAYVVLLGRVASSRLEGDGKQVICLPGQASGRLTKQGGQQNDWQVGKVDMDQTCFQNDFSLIFSSVWHLGYKDEFRVIVLRAPLAQIIKMELENRAEMKHFLGSVFRRHPSRLLMGLGLGSQGSHASTQQVAPLSDLLHTLQRNKRHLQVFFVQSESNSKPEVTRGFVLLIYVLSAFPSMSLLFPSILYCVLMM